MWRNRKAAFPKVAACKEKTASLEQNYSNPEFINSQISRVICAICRVKQSLEIALLGLLWSIIVIIMVIGGIII